MKQEHIDRLNALNAQAQFRSSNVSFVEHPQTGLPKQTGKVICYADIVDSTVKEKYATGSGNTEEQALEDALNKAEVATKPMTPAQKKDAVQVAETTAVLTNRIAELEAQLAAKGSATAPVRRRKKSEPVEETPEPAMTSPGSDDE